MMSKRVIWAQVRWLACVPALPVVALQARGVWKNIPRLPEATGPRKGAVEGKGPPLHLAVIGESTSVGVGAQSIEAALPGRAAEYLAARADREVVWSVHGQNGATIAHILREMVPTMKAPIDIAMVALGVNDVFRLTSVNKWVGRIKQLAERLHVLGCKQVLLSQVPPIGAFPALNNPLRAVLGARAALLDAHLAVALDSIEGAHYAPIDFAADASSAMAADGVHPSEIGYDEWASQLVAQVQI